LQLSATERDQLLDFDFGELEHQLAIYLGPHLPWEDLRALTFSFVNIMMQLIGREPLSPDVFSQGASMMFPYDLRNTAQIVECHVARLSSSLPTNDEFMGMVDYFLESIHDLLPSYSKLISGSVSSEGSNHPLWECFMAETSDGHVSSTNDSGETS
jgi:hypothetical protein